MRRMSPVVNDLLKSYTNVLSLINYPISVKIVYRVLRYRITSTPGWHAPSPILSCIGIVYNSSRMPINAQKSQ